jgi:hypothetical protein
MCLANCSAVQPFNCQLSTFTCQLSECEELLTGACQQLPGVNCSTVQHTVNCQLSIVQRSIVQPSVFNCSTVDCYLSTVQLLPVNCSTVQLSAANLPICPKFSEPGGAALQAACGSSRPAVPTRRCTFSVWLRPSALVYMEGCMGGCMRAQI